MRWYVLNKIDMATLCKNEADARKVAAESDIDYPVNAPHIATQMRAWLGRSPCAKECGAVSFQVELRRLLALLREALPLVESSAKASHLTDGFRRKPDNAMDSLAHRIRYEVRDMKANFDLDPKNVV